MTGVTSEDAAEVLGEALSGPILTPGDRDYDAVRRVHNGLIDKHPGVIARCVHTADVVDAVRFGRSEGLEISVRGGGHNVAGRAVTDGGLMIDLSLMKGIHVDPVRSTVRAQAGVTVGELDRATGAFGLASPSGVVSTTGIAGLTLGGGIGWLMGKMGWPSTTCCRPRWCSPRARSSPRVRTGIAICSGRSAEVAATSAS